MKRMKQVFLLFAVLFCGSLTAQTDLEQLMQSRGEYFFTLTVEQSSEIQNISDLCSVANTDGKTVACYANQNEYETLLKLGYHPQLQIPPSLLEKPIMYEPQRGKYEWDSYLSYEQYEAMMQQFATGHPERCTYFELGTLNSGRKLMFCRINNGQPDGKPKFLYTSTIHGDELTGMILMLRLIDELCTSSDARIVNLVNNLDIFICPCINPDGTYYTGNNSVEGARRKNLSDVDLNRHYPDFVSGPHPDGEVCYQDEAQWMMNLAQDYHFTMAATYHGGAQVLNYPWDNYTQLSADNAWWEMVCREYADLVHEACHATDSTYMTDYNDGIVRGCVWYMISGGRQDYMNYYQQCREVTIECSRVYTPNASQLPTYWNYNHNSMLRYMEQCLNGIHGTITDAETGLPVEATVSIVGHDNHGSEVSSHLPAGDYHRPIKGGTYNVTYSAYGYESQTITVSVNDNEAVTKDVQLVPIGSPLTVDFSFEKDIISTGTCIHFSDLSQGIGIAGWTWEFEGGTPSVSTERHPNVTYNTKGEYNVTLTVTTSQGESQTVIKSGLIQVFDTYPMQNGTFSTTRGMFTSSGGDCGGYSNHESLTMTFLPDAPEHKIEVVFQRFKTENGHDYLTVYDGTNINAPQIGTYSGTQMPDTLVATNAQGALTFKFYSDDRTVASGWQAIVKSIGNVSVDDDTVKNMKVYPNPTRNCFTIEAEGNVHYRLFNALGQCVISGEFKDKTQIDAATLRQGIYFLHLSNGSESKIEKLVIEK